MPGGWKTRRPLIALVALLVLLAVGYAVQASRDGGGGSSPTTAATTAATTATPAIPSTSASIPAGSIALSSLPAQARQTVALIQAGGPFPYDQDGAVFRNDERRLPSKPSGYYHEYTVRTPGASDRGARRIIVGTGGEYYYTADHYETFQRVDLTR